jgi:hypothetical protein
LGVGLGVPLRVGVGVGVARSRQQEPGWRAGRWCQWAQRCAQAKSLPAPHAAAPAPALPCRPPGHRRLLPVAGRRVLHAVAAASGLPQLHRIRHHGHLRRRRRDGAARIARRGPLRTSPEGKEGAASSRPPSLRGRPTSPLPIFHPSVPPPCAQGALLGGFIGDRMARRMPDSGRIFTAQASVASGIPLTWLLLKGGWWKGPPPCAGRACACSFGPSGEVSRGRLHDPGLCHAPLSRLKTAPSAAPALAPAPACRRPAQASPRTPRSRPTPAPTPRCCL